VPQSNRRIDENRAMSGKIAGHPGDEQHDIGGERNRQGIIEGYAINALCVSLLATAGLIAAYLPAGRASRLDPMPVLREE
jgi:hypothetical protein